jgi:hypothetical protein
MKKYLIFTFFSLFLFSYCKEVEIVETKDSKPIIEFLNINSDTFMEFKDSVVIMIGYSDGNGDLGYENADLTSVFIRDSRLENYDEYYLKPLSPPKSKIPISGKLKILLPPLFILNPGIQENTRFEIYLEDKSGNRSNIVFTPIVTIVK